MENLTILEGETLRQWEKRLTSIELNLLTVIKTLNNLSPFNNSKSSVPDFISIEDAAIKYNTSKTTIHNKINLFFKVKGREIDRLQKGPFNLVNEIELLEAMRISSPTPSAFKKKRGKE